MIRYLVVFCTFLFIVSCNSDDDSAPVQTVAPGTGIDIQTTPPTEIKSNSAISGGIISSDGGKLITERGVCWDSFPDPTILKNRTLNGQGSGVFISEIGNLAPATKYYLRAYAKNSLGVTYADQMVFTTLALPDFMRANVTGFFNTEMYTENILNTTEVFSGENYKYIDFRNWQDEDYSFYIYIKENMVVNSSLNISTLNATDSIFVICFTVRKGLGDYDFYSMTEGNLDISTTDNKIEMDFTGSAQNTLTGLTISVQEAKISISD